MNNTIIWRKSFESFEMWYTFNYCLFLSLFNNTSISYPGFRIWVWSWYWMKNWKEVIVALTSVMVTPAFCLGGPRFKSWPRDRLSWLRVFVVFLGPSRQIRGEYLKIRPWPFPSKFFPFHHLSPCHPKLYRLRHWKCVSKQTANKYSLG
jgi:hypothetical protein